MISIHPEKETRLIASIKRFTEEQLEEEVGDLKASLLLEFCVKEIGPVIYNQAVEDVRALMLQRVEEVDETCYEPEFIYWSR